MVFGLARGKDLRWLELVLAAIVASGLVWSEWRFALISSGIGDARDGLLGAIVGVSGTLLGFSVTIMSIIVAVSTHAALEGLRRHDDYPRLWDTFHVTAWCFGGAMVVGLVSIALHGATGGAWGLAITLGAFVGAAVGTLRSLRIYARIIGAVARKDRDDAQARRAQESAEEMAALQAEIDMREEGSHQEE